MSSAARHTSSMAGQVVCCGAVLIPKRMSRTLRQATDRTVSAVDGLADLPQRGGERSPQLARRRRRQVTDQPRARLTELLDGQLDARVLALLAVVEHRDDPADVHSLGIVRGVVVGAVVG